MDEATSSNNNGSRNAPDSENATRYRVNVLKAMNSIGSAPTLRPVFTCLSHAVIALTKLLSEANRLHGDVSPRNLFYVDELNGSPGFGVLSDFDSPAKRLLEPKEPESCAKEAPQGNNVIAGSMGVLPVD